MDKAKYYSTRSISADFIYTGKLFDVFLSNSASRKYKSQFFPYG
jgi:hypothetical protein